MTITWDDEIDPNLSKEVHLGGLEKQYGLDNGVLKGLWKTESANGSSMRTKLSSAKGHFQFINSTAKAYGLKNPDDFYESSDAAARYLKDLKEQFGGDMVKAIAAYKAGPGAVQKHGVAAPAMGPNPDAAYINKVLGAPNEAKIAWDDATSALENQLDTFQKNYNAENLGGLPEVAKEVREMPWLQKAMIAAGKTATGFQYGLKDLGYFASDFLGDKEAPIKSVLLQKERDEENRLYTPFNESAGISAPLIGGTLPYLAPTPISPLAKKAGSAILDAVSLPIKSIGSSSKTLLEKITEKSVNSKSTLLKTIGEKMEKDLVAPMQANRTARLNQVSLKDPYYADLPQTVLGGAIQGGIEGGLNYDTSIGSGMLAGGAGTLAGVGLRKFTNKLPDYRQPHERELLDWYKQQGGQPSHGLDSGSKRLQNFENQLEKTPRTGDAAALYKQENQLVDNKIAYKAMGFKDPEGTAFSPQSIKEHLGELKKGYEELEKNTTAKITNEELRLLDEIHKEISTNPSKSYKRQANIAKDYINAIKQNVSTIRDAATGQIKTRGLTGEKYQSLRSELQDQISSAYSSGNYTTAKSLEPIKKILDDALERAVAESKGTATLKQWKDLNTRYAASHTVLEHGMTPSGIDAAKLHNYFQTSNPKQYYTESGNSAFTELHKLGKIGYMRKNQDRAFGGLKNPGSVGLISGLIGTPAGGMLPGFERAALSMYKLGIPSRYGLLGMGKDNKFKVNDFEFSLPNFWRGPEVYTKALGQSSQAVPRLVEYLSSVKEKFNSEK
jgi:Transglycosylase SLT domain